MARRNLARTSSGAAVVALLLAARAGCDTGQQADRDASAADSHADTRAALLAAGDADSLEAAALLTPKNLSVERLELVSRAAAAAPARPDLAWLALQSCIQAESCDVTPREAGLRAVDPGNGAAWMGTLARAAAGTPQLRASLAGIADSARFDIYWNPLIVHVADALERTKTMEDREAIVLAIGLAAAQAIPALQQMSRGCGDAAHAQPADPGICRKLSAVLRHSDTAIVEGLGLSIALRVWPASSDEYRRAADEIRVLHFRMRQPGEWSSVATSDERAKRYLRQLATHRTEQEALVADLISAGIDPSPPAGWTDPAS
jgi:hypothetical protein